jgi:hypothetical protein
LGGRLSTFDFSDRELKIHETIGPKVRTVSRLAAAVASLSVAPIFEISDLRKTENSILCQFSKFWIFAKPTPLF